MDFRSEIEALKSELAQQARVIREMKLSRRERALQALRRHKRILVAGGLIGFFIPVVISALNITKTFTFTAGDPTVASEVNTNFDQLFTKVNDLAAFHPPIGTILAWHKDLPGVPVLPASGEWVQCNGQTLADAASPMNGQVIPNLNGAGGGANSPGQSSQVQMFLRGGTTSGTGQQDAFQGHWHEVGNGGGPAGNSGSSGRFTESPDAGWTDGALAFIRNPKTDGTNGTPRTAAETRPVNMSVVWIMKVK